MVNRPLTFQSHALKYTITHATSWGIQVPTDSNGRFATLQSIGDNMWWRRLCIELWNVKVVKPTWILMGLLMTTLCVVWGHSQVDIDSYKLSSWKVVHQCEHVNTHWWTTFQLLSLWLCRRDCDLRRHNASSLSRPSRSGLGYRRVCARVIFLLIRFISWISTNFDNLYRHSNNQSHVVFLIFSACLVSCQVSNAMNLQIVIDSMVQLKL